MTARHVETRPVADPHDAATGAWPAPLLLGGPSPDTVRDRLDRQVGADGPAAPWVTRIGAAPPESDVRLDVTVVIPAFDRQQYVAEAVRSALAQRPHPPAEVLVVDDASRDGTAEAARRAGARVLRLEVNRGRGGARNAGIAAATRPWVALLDSDDVWEPHHLARLWPHRHGRVLVSASALSSRRARVFGNPGRRPLEITSPRQLFWPENPVVTSSVLLDKQALLVAGGFSERVLAQDLDTWITLLEHGTGLVLPDVHVSYREHAGQASADRSAVHAAVRDILAAHRHQSWHSRSLVGRLHGLQDAELLAMAWRRRRWRELAGVAGRLASRPAAVGSLVSAALWHRRARLAAATPVR